MVEEYVAWKERYVMRKQLNDVILIEDKLIINFAEHTMQHNDYPENIVEIEPKPYELLSYMWNNKNQLLNKKQILDDVWGESSDYYDNVIKDTISKIRGYITCIKVY